MLERRAARHPKTATARAGAMGGRNVYMIAMQSVPTHQTDDLPAHDGRFATRIALAGFGLMFVSAAVTWVSFGPSIFYDALAFASACF